MSNSLISKIGWALYDWANSAFATVILAAVLPVYFVHLVPEGGIHFLSLTIPASALWSSCISLSMLILVLAAPKLGNMADRRASHLKMLKVFCLSGAIATALLGVVEGYGWVVLLFIIANFSFATGNIAYNSLLNALTSTSSSKDRLSAQGFALGYIGGGLALLAVMLLIKQYEFIGLQSASQATKVGFIGTGIWWLMFGWVALWMMKGIKIQKQPESPRSYLKLVKELKSYPQVVRFLLAYLLYNDGIQTIIAVSAIYARETIGLSQSSILGCFLMIQFVAAPGALLFGWLSQKKGSKLAILISLALFTVVTVYACFLKTSSEFWLMGFVVALILGGSQAASRSLFASLIPSRRKAEFFGFYAVSSKFASIFGPLIFALATIFTGSTKIALLFIVFLFVCGGLLLSRLRLS